MSKKPTFAKRAYHYAHELKNLVDGLQEQGWKIAPSWGKPVKGRGDLLTIHASGGNDYEVEITVEDGIVNYELGIMRTFGIDGSPENEVDEYIGDFTSEHHVVRTILVYEHHRVIDQAFHNYHHKEAMSE